MASGGNQALREFLLWGGLALGVLTAMAMGIVGWINAEDPRP